jgi:hypothetical protein
MADKTGVYVHGHVPCAMCPTLVSVFVFMFMAMFTFAFAVEVCVGVYA